LFDRGGVATGVGSSSDPAGHSLDGVTITGGILRVTKTSTG